jgi:hypothetical protein
MTRDDSGICVWFEWCVGGGHARSRPSMLLMWHEVCVGVTVQYLPL